jgi:hypothetical protein
MPTPPHLQCILDALGTGGTVDQAARIHTLIQAEIDAAPRTTLTLTPDTEIQPGHVYVLRIPHGVNPADIDPVSLSLEAKFIVLTPDEQLTALDDPESEIVARLIDERDAALAAAAPPDVALLQADRDRLRDEEIRPLAEIIARLFDQATDPDSTTCITAAQLLQDQATALRAAFQQIAALTDPAQKEPSAETPETDSADSTDGIDCDDDALGAVTITDLMMIKEAAASVALDHDPRAETIALPPDPSTDDSDGIDWGDEDNPEPDAPMPTTAEIRAWCAGHGVPCSRRGAIPRAARAAYTAAHKEA